MRLWLAAVLAVCVVAITVALVWAIVAVGRLGRRAESLLAVVQEELERDVPPLVANLRDLTGELRVLSSGLNAEVQRIGLITERIQEIGDSAASLLAALSGLTRAGQLIGIAAGVKTGVDVFLHRLRKSRGEDGHE